MYEQRIFKKLIHVIECYNIQWFYMQLNLYSYNWENILSINILLVYQLINTPLN